MAPNPEAFWRLLRDSICAVTEIPASRWNVDDYYDADPQAPGKSYCRYGSFVEDIDQFDAKFFRISPREALALDPQQRLLLEVSWEALERAGLAAEKLIGSQTGVFIGMGPSDYIERVRSLGEESIFNTTGNEASFAAGRLSYFLGTQGPNMAIDTACSSSLVALHQAVTSLRQQECELALVGAVRLRLSPDSTLDLSGAQALSADGRCKTFAANADGFGRGEGCGVVVLKRLSDAIRDKDNVLALIRGSAINHGGPSSGLTVPNEDSQEKLIRKALKNAAVKPADVSYIEAHGTGTILGDPIEISALASVFAENNEDRADPLFIGSVKTNLAHLEAAAGMAGLIKVILSLQHQEIPPHLHFKQPNPQTPWQDLPFVIPTERTPWPAGERRRIAGVSSFGMSGTNAHVVLSEAPPATPIDSEHPWHILTLSAKTEHALDELANRYEQHLRQNLTLNLADVCFTANTGRSHFAHRLSVVASSAEEMYQKLASSSITGVARDMQRPQIAFLFTGQGAQYVGMGQQLYDHEPLFRQILDRCDEILRTLGYVQPTLLDVLYPNSQPSNVSLLNETSYTQIALFALEYALAQLWLSWGVTPSVVMGHSVGEYVAACVVGVFSLEDALKLMAARGRLMGALPQDGAMVSLMADEAHVQQTITPVANDVSMAAVNGPESVVISGKREAVQAIALQLAADGVKTQKLTVSHAFHSSLMEPMLDEFRQVAKGITYHPPKLPLVSNVTGKLADDAVTTAAYWVEHVRQTVRFADGVRTLHDQGANLFLEIGPKATLLGMAMMNEKASGTTYLPSLRESQNDWEQMLTTLGELYVRGVAVDWEGFYKASQRHKVVLPTYPFQRERHYITPNGLGNALTKQGQGAASLRQSEHPLLGRRLHSPLIQDICFASQISFQNTPFLKDHQILGQAIFLVAGFVEMGISAAKRIFGVEHVMAEDMLYESPLIMNETWPETVQLMVQNFTAGANSCSFQVVSMADGAPSDTAPVRWRTHAQGILRAGDTDASDDTNATDNAAAQAIAAALGGLYEEIDPDSFYGYLYGYGYQFGPAYRGVKRLWYNQTEAVSEVMLPKTLASEFDQYAMHPALLDACSHALFSLVSNLSPKQLFLTIGQDRFEWFSPPTQRVWVHATLNDRATASDTFIGNLAIYAAMDAPSSPVGRKIAVLQGYMMKQGTREGLAKTLRENNRNDFRNLLHEVKWKEATHAPDRAPIPLQVTLGGSLWVLFADQGYQAGEENSLTDRLCQSLDESQATYIKVLPGQEFAQVERNLYTINPENPEHYERILEAAQQVKYEACVNFRGVMHLWSVQPNKQTDEGLNHDLSYQQNVALESALLLSQALVKLPKTKRHARFRLFFMTKGAQAISEQEMESLFCNTTHPLVHSPARPLASALWGMSRVIGQEHPELHLRYVDFDPADGEVHPESNFSQNLHLFAHDSDPKQVEPLMALRQGRCFVPRMVKATLRSDTEIPQPPDREHSKNQTANRAQNESTVLITGGLGGIGLEVAQWIARNNSTPSAASSQRRAIALLGRRQPSTPAEELLQKIRATGTTVRVFLADVSDWDRMTTVLHTIEAEMPPLRGVVHGAGIQDDNLLLQMDLQQFRKVLAAKVQGAWNLHLLTAEMPLDFFVLFSSLASLLNKIGVSNYAAANAFLDGLARYRRSQGLKALSINWGTWGDVGFLTKLDDTTRELWLTAEGVEEMTSQEGIQLFECMLDQSGTQYAAFRIDWPHWLDYFTSSQKGIPALVAELVDLPALNQKRTGGTPQTTRSTETESVSIADDLQAAPPNQRLARMTDYIRSELAEVLGCQDTQLNVQEGFFEMGLNSLMAIQLKTRLQSGLDQALSPTLAFNYPTIEQLTQHLLTNVLRLTVSTDSEESRAEDKAAMEPMQIDSEALGLDQDDEQAALLSEIDAMPDDLVEGEFTK
jgi:acyl transferase domain-containing protein/acyl carrier protein